MAWGVAFYVVAFLAVLFLFIAALLILYAVFSFLYAHRLMDYKESGRIGTMIIGGINLINIPFGTAFGIAALAILTKPEVENMFRRD